MKYLVLYPDGVSPKGSDIFTDGPTFDAMNDALAYLREKFGTAIYVESIDNFGINVTNGDDIVAILRSS